MNILKEVKAYCRKCKKHTSQKLKLFKEGSKSAGKRHARKHEKKHVKGYGGKARHTMGHKKQGKKSTFVMTCPTCGKKAYLVMGMETKKKPELK